MSSTATNSPSRAEWPTWLEFSRCQIEHMCHMIVGAINNRDFNVNSDAWSVTHEHFSAKAAFAQWPKETTLQELLRCYEDHTRLHPYYTLQLQEVMIKIDEKKSIAKAFVNLLSDGIPPGKIRQSVGMLEFMWIDGKWCCSRYQCVPGMAPAAPGSCI
ncbi:Hypothetical predicted protein [Lecanosticta acicola]|uniref:Uncharacterized protein n=1 Tax=Lecanosticta acicola TaxID=111012 RepID=A0AAI9E905_9PEZI|nr:Hypothetical predicted protein [Lecanosticta acicola]